MSTPTITTNTGSKPRYIQSNLPCEYFLTEQGCRHGKKCRNSHNVQRIVAYYKLHNCSLCAEYTNADFELCKRCHWLSKTYQCDTPMCKERIRKGNYCDACNTAYYEEKQKAIDAMEPEPCTGMNCYDMAIKGRRLCKACQQTHDHYIVRR